MLSSFGVYKSIAVAAIMILVGAGCEAKIPEVPSDFSVSLMRSVCLGSCPVYSLMVFADGSVLYDGMKFVPIEGHRRASISASEVAELYRTVIDDDFFELEDDYAGIILDAPFTTISITLNGNKKIVRGIGCESSLHRDFCGAIDRPPDVFCEIEDMLDGIAASNGWVSRDLIKGDRSHTRISKALLDLTPFKSPLNTHKSRSILRLQSLALTPAWRMGMLANCS